MDPTPPHRQKRRWPWVLLSGFLIAAGLWLVFLSDTAQPGDAGYKRMLRDMQRLESIARWRKRVPDLVDVALRPLQRRTEQSRFLQFASLRDVGFITHVKITLTNRLESWRHLPEVMSQTNVVGSLLHLAPDQRYPPCTIIYSQGFDDVCVRFICRSQDAATFASVYGESNTVVSPYLSHPNN